MIEHDDVHPSNIIDPQLFIDYAEAAKQTYTYTKKTIKASNIKDKKTLKKKPIQQIQQMSSTQIS